MTKLEAIQKIRKLPKLKEGYNYDVYVNGKVVIEYEGIIQQWVYKDFNDFVKNQYYFSYHHYERLLAKPIYEDDEIVGYE